jgi:protein gp37
MTTNIAWTDETWNPTVGCSIVSPGCTNCYAMKMAERLEGMASKPDSTGNFHLDHYKGTTNRGTYNSKPTHWTGKLALAPERTLLKPLSWKKPRRIFVNSMSDLFHKDVPDDWIDKVFAVMALCPQHTFQVLTKRSKRMREYMTTKGVARRLWDLFDTMRCDMELSEYHPAFNSAHKPYDDFLPLNNVHLGVSCEDQTRADERIPDLLATPAAVRFVSAEPMLGPIDFTMVNVHRNAYADALRGYERLDGSTPVLNWIICGGESGTGFRPMQIEWAESIRQQCADAGTAFFFKQDSAHKSGQRGRASDALWGCKQFPEVK